MGTRQTGRILFPTAVQELAQQVGRVIACMRSAFNMPLGTITLGSRQKGILGTCKTVVFLLIRKPTPKGYAQKCPETRVQPCPPCLRENLCDFEFTGAGRCCQPRLGSWADSLLPSKHTFEEARPNSFDSLIALLGCRDKHQRGPLNTRTAVTCPRGLFLDSEGKLAGKLQLLGVYQPADRESARVGSLIWLVGLRGSMQGQQSQGKVQEWKAVAQSPWGKTNCASA